MMITILVDTATSWIQPYARQVADELRSLGHTVHFVGNQADIVDGDCAFFLGCEKLVSAEKMKKNTHNIVIHESALPQGKGWSPLTWQILEGKNDIPITLFEAEEAVDSGVIYLEDIVKFEGHELNEELKHAQGLATIALVKRFVKEYPTIRGREQTGEESFYPRRRPKDSELDVQQSIASQFNLLRVVDNERYPAFFNYRGHRYVLKIYKDDEQTQV